MTDQELVELALGTAPEELSPDQLAEIRRRLPHSPALRQALRRQLALEEGLVRHLGRVEISTGDLLSENRSSPVRGARWTTKAAALFVGMIVCSVAVYLFLDAAELLGPHPMETTAHEPQAETGAPETRGDEPAATPGEARPTDAPPRRPREAPPRRPRQPASPTRRREEPKVAANPSPAPPTAPVSWPELEVTQPLVPFAVAAFQDISDPNVGLSPGQLSRWLAAVPQERSRFTEEKRGETPIAGFEGVVRLQPAWTANAVLRMAPFDHDGLAVHFWRGTTGVSLYYYEHPQPVWAAYQTTRTAGRLRPATHVLLATDNQRYDRSLRGVVEIRHQSGELVFSRGDLRLLTMPLESPPTEVYFDRRAKFRTFAMYRGEPIPAESTTEGANLLPEKPPARLAWTSDMPKGAQLHRDPGGTIRLERGRSAPAAWSGVKLPRTGLYEVIVQLDDATPGAGVYLGDESGRPRQVIGLRRESNAGRPVVAFLKPDDRKFESEATVATQLVPYAGKGQWLRVVPGCGTIRCWVSGDGRHWGRALEPLRGIDVGFSHVGLTVLESDGPTSIGIRSLRVHELTDLTGLADADLASRVPAEILRPASFAAWCNEVLARQPPGVGAAAWRVACAVQTLSAGRLPRDGNRVLAGLLDDSLDRLADPDAQLRVLDQASLIYDAWEPPEADRLLQSYDRFGRSLAQRGHPRPFSLVGGSLMSGPIWCSAPFQVFPESLVRAEVIGLVCNDQWSALLDLCRRLRFWNRASQPEQFWPDHRLAVRRLAEWAEARAREETGERDGGAAVAATAAPRRNHFVEVVTNKDALTSLEELQAALADGQDEEACRIIVGSRLEQLAGLLPDRKEPQLFRSLPQVVAAAMRERPDLRRTMTEKYGALGRIRVEQAVARGADDALLAAAVQFCGTSAAAVACRWLGDRALVEGRFVAALEVYRRGRMSADPDQEGDFAARERLASALMGRERTGSGDQSLALADRAVPPAEFQALLAELIRSRSGIGGSADGASPVGRIAPAVWRAEKLNEWKAPASPPKPAPGSVDWSARQTTMHVSGDRLLISNLWQIGGFDANTGKRLWTHTLATVGRTAPNWPALAVRPVTFADQVVVRRPQRTGASLAGIDAATGKPVWGTDASLNVLSDPFLIEETLYCFATSSPSPPGDSTWHLNLATVDPGSGAVRSQSPVLDLVPAGDRLPACQAVFTGTRLIASVCGAVFCCELSGRTLWMRRQTLIPLAADVYAGEQAHDHPILIGDRVLVTQPGVRCLECLDAETGRLHWRLPLSDGRRLLGHDRDQAYIDAARGIVCVSITDGRIAWVHPVSELLDAHVVSNDGSLLYLRREAGDGDRSRPLMVWLDPRTGNEAAVWPLAELEDKAVLLGPFGRHKNQLFALSGREPGGGPRNLWRLTPTSDPAFTGHSDPQAVDRWTAPPDDPHLNFLASRFLPEWSILGGLADPKTGFREEFQGETEVLAARIGPNEPVVFTREVALEAASRSRLVIVAGHETAERWTLRVRVAGEVLLSSDVDSRSVRKNWGRWQVDLSRFAGQTVRLVVEQRTADKPASVCWKQLEIVP